MATKNAPVSCKVDGTEFSAAEAAFVMDSQIAREGLPQHAVPNMSVHVRIDLNNGTCDFATIKKLFQLSKEPSKENIKDMSIVFWVSLKDNNATCSYQFRGWVSSFRTSYSGHGNGNYGQVLDVVLTPDTSKDNFPKIDLSN